jgi:pimeloyl-ACP methyl ester carboxylesterase
LIAHLKLNQFHLYGHSFGGIVAYEYIKELNELQLHTPPLSPTAINTTPSEPELLSVTLCSVPSNVREIEVECKSLVASLKSTSNQRCESFDSYSSGDVSLEENSSSTYHDVFQNAFVCRSNDGTIPQPLQVAYSKKGEAWEGHEAIIDYVAQPLFNVGPCSKITRSPALLLRGEHDFISEKYGIDTWKQLLLLNYHKSVETQTFSGCAHYSMLENPGLHSITLNSFLRSHEETMEHIQEVIAAQ